MISFPEKIAAFFTATAAAQPAMLGGRQSASYASQARLCGLDSRPASWLGVVAFRIAARLTYCRLKSILKFLDGRRNLKMDLSFPLPLCAMMTH